MDFLETAWRQSLKCCHALRRIFVVKPLILLVFELVEPSGIEPLTS